MDFERFNPEIRYEIFSRLPARDLFVCRAVCKPWKDLIDGECEGEGLWGEILESSTPASFRDSPLLKKLKPARKLVIYENTWSDHHISPNVYIKENKITIHRNPVPQSSDVARGKTGYIRGRHYWTVTWHGPKLGSNAVVGVATSKEMNSANGYYSLLGSSVESWGWDLVNNVLLHNGDLGPYPDSNREIKMKVGMTIGVILDMDKRTLSFELEDRCLGVAFTGLPPQQLYPAISMVYAHTEATLLYQGQPLEG